MIRIISKHELENFKLFSDICKENLQQKKAKVMAEVKKLELDKENTYDHYKYASAPQTSDEMRPLLAKYGITLSVTEKEVELGQTTTSQDKKSNYCKITLSVTLINADCPVETETVDVSGFALDRGDKALYKAKTTAMKYFYWLEFGLSYGDDVEEDDMPATAPNYHKQIKVEARKKLMELVGTAKGAKEFMDKHFKGKKFDTLTVDELENLVELIDKELKNVSKNKK